MNPEILRQLITTGVVLLGTVSVWLILNRTVAHWVERIGTGDGISDAERRQRATTLWGGIRRVMLAIFGLVVVLTVMNLWNIPIGSFIAIGSAVGVAVGFGAQSVVKDVIAGFLILVENQFAIGDVVRIAGIAGSVQEMRLRVTVLRDLDGYVHYVPNGTIAVASNYTSMFSRVVLTVGISYSSDVDLAIQVMGDELSAMADDHPTEVLEPPQMLGVEELGNSAVSLRALMVVGPQDRWAMRREALRRIKKRFDSEGIEIPFQQVTVHMSPPPPAAAPPG
ncbi:MAG: mechanosensitive ion channel family protein [Acidimicrobiia bacterium]